MTATSAAYSPQKHAAAVVDHNAHLVRLANEIAAMRGQITQLSRVLLADRGDSEALSHLVEAIANAMGYTRSWYAAELLSRATAADDIGADLLACIAATGCQPSTKSLGKYLAKNAIGGRIVSESGYLLENTGADSTGLIWTVQRV